MPNNQVYWRQVDGKYIINYRITSLAIPLIVFSAPLQEMNHHAKGSFFDWTIASTIACTVVAFFYFFADITIFRERHQKMYPIIVCIAFGAFLGFTKGFLTGFTASKMSLVEGIPIQEIYTRSIAGLFIGAMLVPISAFLLAAVNDYSVERKKLIDDFLILEEQIRGDSEALDELKSKLSTNVDENLTKSLLNAQNKIKTDQELGGQWQEIANTLREAAEETIRPLSHAMWNVRQKEMQLTTLEFLKFAFKNIQIRPVVILPVFIATTIMSVQVYGDIWKSTYIMILKSFMVWVLLEIGQTFLELLKDRFKNLLLFILLTIGIFHFLLTELIYRTADFQESYLDLSESIWLILLILITGISDSALRTQIFQIKTLKGLIANKRIELISNERELDRVGREMARYLHGTIQSKLMAAAMAVELAGKKKDEKQLNIEIEKALKTLQMPTQEYLDTRVTQLRDGLDDLANKWDGIVNLKYKTNDQDIFSQSETLTLIDLVNEAILNAYRHGNASNVSIQIERVPKNLIQLKVFDDGNGVNSIKPGLGSQYFNSITRNWSLDNQKTKKGAVLTIEF